MGRPGGRERSEILVSPMASQEGSTPPRSRDGAVSSLGGRAIELVRSVPPALAVIVGIAILLRLAITLAYSPATMNFADTPTYLFMADGRMFEDPVRPAGYSMFLRIVHAVSSEISVTIALQHLLGILTGAFMYLTVIRVGAPRWAALVAGAAIWLSLDQVLFEHTPMAEPVFTLLFVAALYACVRATEDPHNLVGPLTTRHAWIAAAGSAFGFAAWMRAAGAPVVLLVALWFALAIPGRVWDRFGRAALAGGMGMAVILAYFAMSASVTDNFGFSRASGWVLYARTAPFADCTKFEPPAGTEGLCETVSRDDRQGPDSYLWGGDSYSPAYREFGPIPEGDEQLGEFARAAIKGQPGTYALTVVNETVRYLVPAFHARYNAADYGYFEIRRRDPVVEPVVDDAIDSYYEDESLSVDSDAVSVMTDLQQLLRVHPLLLLQGVILGVIGIVLSRGRVRWALVLLVGAGLSLLAVPSATATWSARYAIPADGPLVAAGAIGLWLIISRLRERSAAAPGPAEPA